MQSTEINLKRNAPALRKKCKNVNFFMNFRCRYMVFCAIFFQISHFWKLIIANQLCGCKMHFHFFSLKCCNSGLLFQLLTLFNILTPSPSLNLIYSRGTKTLKNIFASSLTLPALIPILTRKNYDF